IGYTVSRSVVKRNEPQLKELLQAKDSLYYRTKEPEKLARYLREAINAAKEFEEYAHYAVLSKLYTFRVVHEHPSRVEAVYNVAGEVSAEPLAAIEEEVSSGQKLSNLSTPASKPQTQPTQSTRPKKTIPDAISIIDVLGFAMRLKDVETELFFPNARLKEEDKIR